METQVRKNISFEAIPLNQGSELSVLVKVTDEPSPLIAVGTTDNRIHLFNPFTKQYVQTLLRDDDNIIEQDFKAVTALLPFTFEKRPCLIAGYADGCIKVWDLISYECIKSLDNDAEDITSIIPLSSVTFAARSADSRITIWNLTTNTSVQTINAYNHRLQKLSDEMIAAITNGNNISIWNPETGKRIKKLSGHKKKITALAHISSALKNQSLLISGEYDGEIKVWDLTNYKCLFTFQLQDCSPFSFVSLPQNTIAIATTKGVIIYDLLKKSSQTLVKTQNLISINTNKSILLVRDGEQILTYNSNNLNHQPCTYSIRSNDWPLLSSTDSALFSNDAAAIGYQHSILVLQEQPLNIKDSNEK